MKTIHALLFLSLLITLSGCTELKFERYIEDNIFYSSSLPKIKIKIDPDFKYFGTYKENKNIEYTYHDTETVGSLTKEDYLFGYIGKNNILKRGFLISISTLHKGYWFPEMYSGKNKLDSGSIKIHGDIYQYSINVFGKILGKKAEKIIFDNGHKVANCYLVKVLGKRIGAANESKIDIFYFENINYKHKFRYTCNDWINVNTLKIDQVIRLKKFRDRSEINMQILQ